MLYPLLFNPNLHTLVWGGNRLKPMKHLPADQEPIGESWEVSAVPTSPSIIANGHFAGMSLDELCEEHGLELMGGANLARYGGRFPLLIKFIDAMRDLSIQVHPNDELAQKRHGKMGKTEMWYVIDAQPGASLYSGFKKNISKEEYNERVANGTITEVLARHKVKKGDVFYIPAGRVHAICGGILLAEVQQSSDVTYRIFDYNRLGLDGRPRELHTELAVDAIDFEVKKDYLTHYKRVLNFPEPVIESPFFKVKMLRVSRKFHRKMFKYDTFVIYMCLKGGCTITQRRDGSQTVLGENDTCLIPAVCADYDVEPLNRETKVLEIYIDNRAAPLTRLKRRIKRRIQKGVELAHRLKKK